MVRQRCNCPRGMVHKLLRATTTKGVDGHVVDALPIDETVKILKKYNAVKP